MKKLCYFITFIFSFLFLKTSCFAYSSQIQLNYDNFDKVLQSNPRYQTIIDGISSKLDSSNLRYYIFINSTVNSTQCGNGYSLTQNEYNTYCSVSNIEDNGGYVVSVRIYNPSMYNTDGSVQNLYFGISGGYSYSHALIGPMFGDYYSSDTINVYPSVAKPNAWPNSVKRFNFSSTDLSELDSWLSNPTFDNSASGYFNAGGTTSRTDDGLFYQNYMPYFIYSNIKMPYKYVRYVDSLTGTTHINSRKNLLIVKNNDTITTQIDEDAIFYYSEDSFDVIDVENFGNNSFGFYNNVLSISNYIDENNNFTANTIQCMDKSRYPNEDGYKDFNNGYCLFEREDFGNFTDSQILNSKFMFFDLTGHIDYLLFNNKYYAYNFRLLKPFVPKVDHLNLTINNTGNPFPVNIDKVYKNDGGSYVDYVVVFYYNGPDNAVLNNINVAFANPISFYQNNVGYDFVFGVYRSFKLAFYDTKPNADDISDFYHDNDLSTIDGVNKSTSFFDTTFNTFGFGGIVTAPFRLLYSIIDLESCSPISFPFPHSNKNLTLACVRSSIPSSINPLIIALQTILSGFICYRIAVGTLSIIKEVLEPDNANIEVVDL